MSDDQASEVRMVVKGLMLDPTSNNPIVILQEQDSDLFLPIWIGVFEASAIQLRIEGVEPQRPMTHDLLVSVLAALGARLHRVVISDLRENTFFATLHLLRASGEEIEVDSRPSDALALALRVDAPVFVRRQVLERAQAVDLTTTSDEEKLKKWLESLSPEDLGKYTM